MKYTDDFSEIPTLLLVVSTGLVQILEKTAETDCTLIIYLDSFRFKKYQYTQSDCNYLGFCALQW